MEHSNSRWNVRIKTYPDGHQQYLFSEFPVKKQIFDVEKVKHDGSKVEKKELENCSRAIQSIYDYCRSTYWDWFITLTFSPKECDRSNYVEVSNLMVKFTQSLRYYQCLYVVIPEQHKDGAWHFHGLIKGDLPVEPAFSPKGKPLFDNKGRRIYNITNFNVGYTTATAVGNSDRAVSYLTKYLTKSKMFAVPKGRKRFWASRSLPKPEVDTFLAPLEEISALLHACRYTKKTVARFNTFWIGEV